MPVDGSGECDRLRIATEPETAVAGIGAASSFADVGCEAPTALLPSLRTDTLSAPASSLGLIGGVSDALAGVARFGGGAVADDLGRRRARRHC